MRDLLPEEARARRDLGRKLLERFAIHGYAAVTLPMFEFAEVLERGLGTLDSADVLRFVEPESGEVAALRPDMTPQIARLVATRMREWPPPFRLAYEGTVVRRRSGRAHKHRQIPQVGVELAGVAEPDGDLELLAVAADALRAAGLSRFAIDLGDAGIVRALLGDAPAGVAASISEAIARKDDVELEERARGARGVDVGILRELLRLHGGRDVLASGAKLLAGTKAERALRELTALYDAASARGLAQSITVDLGEVRGFAYYTGPIFHLFAEGPGDAIASGGRYDDLLGRFGAAMPAAGFGIDLDRLAAALRAAGVRAPREERVVVVGDSSDPRLAELRARGTCAVAVKDRTAAFAYARAWGYSHVLDASLEDVKGA
jgi:ATP phosphoribosyltransferase regulatory subunit